jgi:glycosyltransferase involved in cell wall biosynthesis
MTLIITVVITTYNRASLLIESIKSVLNQTFSDFELVIVDDHSSDNTPDLVKSFQDSRIRYIRHDENKGLAASRNTGLRYARGKYIAYLDDDDQWLPEKLARQLEVMESSEHHPCLVYLPGNVSGWMEDYIFNGFTMANSCMFVSTEELAKIGGHSEELKSCIDHDIWMKMAQAKFFMKPVSQPLVKTTETRQISRMTNRLDERFNGIEQFFNKWRPYILENYGASYWQSIETVYEEVTFPKIKNDYLKAKISKKEALRYYRRFLDWQYQPWSKKNLKLWIDYIGFWLGLIEYLPLKYNRTKIVKDFFSLHPKLR